jgi:eukaryotic-like serine/threonine-protein kinase
VSEFTQLGERYDIGQVIGRGGMAEVYEGTDRRLNRRVAIKVLRPDLARDPLFQERFRREAQSAAGLNHPNIVAIYDTGEDVLDDGVSRVTIPYIVMEFVDGNTLRQMMQQGPRILPERSLEIVAGILAALDYAHRHGIVHRDIKPANVMINTHGDAKVMDFGIARAMSDAATSVTTTSAVMGTAQYLSPEQARGELVDARSDIYSTGCLLYEALTGRTPFTGESPVSIAYQHVNETPVPPSQVDPSISATLDSIVLHALAKQPDSRYQTAAEMRADVERAMAGMPIMATANAATTILPVYQNPSPVEEIIPLTQEKPVKKNTLKWLAAGVATMAAAGLIFFAGQTLFGSGISKVTVPNLTSQTVSEASISLQNVQLVLGTQTPQYDDNAPKGTIISQDPTAEELLQIGQKVNIIVSNGKEQISVPDLVDLISPDDAKSALEKVRLVLGKVTYRDSDKPAGSVISQTPSAGQLIDSGSTIAIVVSSGKVQVPDVVGESKSQANTDLVNAGFTIQWIYSVDDTVLANTVLAQTPQGGSMSMKGTTVTVQVSKLSDVVPSASPTVSVTPTPSITATP